MNAANRELLPRVIWTLWLQGWNTAPETALACLESWRRNNPNWRVEALEMNDLRDALGADVAGRILAAEKEPEALSDQIRIELLQTWGGVWVDATAMCATPLDEWLPQRMSAGFFAFAQPAPDRMLASWFLASAQGSYIVKRWHQRTREYWETRTKRDDYFWFHRLFASEYEKDAWFRAAWDSVPVLPARHPFHFAPESGRLIAPAAPEDRILLSAPLAPVFKLTHKLSQPSDEGSLLNLLCRFGRGESMP